MNQWARYLNWTALLVVAISLFALLRLNPNYVGPGVGLLLPFGLALIAARPISKAISLWAAIILNFLFFLVFAFLITTAVAGMVAQPVFVTMFFSPFAFLCISNVLQLRAIKNKKVSNGPSVVVL